MNKLIPALLELFPTARPGIDWAVRIDPDDEAKLAEWYLEAPIPSAAEIEEAGSRRLLADAKAKKISELRAAFDAAVKAGFADTEAGVTIAIDDSSRNDFIQLERQLAAKGTTDPDPVQWGAGEALVSGVIAVDNQVHPMNFGDYRALLTRAGDHYAVLRARLGGLTLAVNAATSIEAVEAVSF